MSAADQLSAYWSRRAEKFDAIYSGRKGAASRLWDRLTRRNIVERFRFTLRAVGPVDGRRILDVGCGSGRYCVELAAGGEAEVVGVDLAPGMLAVAERLAAQRGVGSRCRFIRTDILKYKAAEPFDHIVAMGFFDYVLQPRAVLSHLRTLADGNLIASFPCRLSGRAPFRMLWLRARGCYVRFYGRSEVEALCALAGFEVRTLVRRGPIYLLIAGPSRGVGAHEAKGE
jgi:2-polyprenyl-3-methyl-5-hydroxy-6-metoxy-1,4-benzoquinol methylase